MAFDPRAYEDTVLKPMRRLLPSLPDDLQTRYAVDPAMDAAALRERVETVVKLWNKLAMRSDRGGLVAKQLVHEHRQLEAEGKDVGTPQFWTAWRAQRPQTVGTAVDELAAHLRAEYGALGVITRQQLRETAEGGLSEADVDRARERAGLKVVDPLELPTKPVMRGQLQVLNNALIEAGAASIPELLFPELTSFGLLDGLTITPRPAGRTAVLDEKAATDRMTELDKLPDSGRIRAVRTSVGLLVAEAKAGVDLTALALFHVLQPVREKQAQGVGPGTLFAQLIRRKVQPSDAGRIVVSLLAAGVAPRGPAEEVAELLAEGRLVAAGQLAAGVGGEDGDAARANVARVQEQVTALRSAAVEHLRAGRDEQAGDALRQAVALATDMKELTEQLAALPAPPVLAASAVADGAGVRITWRPAPAHGRSTAIGVVRGRGRVPDNPDDGTPVPVSGTHATDAEPPVGTEAHYAVFARIGRGPWSRPVAATVRVVPPVSDVVVDGGTGVVTGRWKVHPGVVTVEVRRSAGSPDAPAEPVRVERNRAFRDDTARDGVQYFYRLVATYAAAGGATPLRSAPVLVRGATRVEARPVTSLGATVLGGATPMVRLTWGQKRGSETVVWRAGKPCPWEYGAVVDRADLAGWGTELDGDTTLRGDQGTLLAAIPPGRSWIVPFTVAPDGLIRGQDAYVELIEPVRGLVAQRFGDDLRVTWTWPDAAGAAEVTWAGGRRRVTLAQYREEGGCRLRSVPAVRRIDVEAVVLGAADEARAPAVSVVVEDRPAQLRYEVRRRGHRLAGGVKAIVTVASPDPVPRATVILVGSAGPVMPLSPDAGIELLREAVTVEPGVPRVLPEVTLPNELRKPYWLRCFLAENTVQLVDPPVSQLKVS